jgi:hypothetical protein
MWFLSSTMDDNKLKQNFYVKKPAFLYDKNGFTMDKVAPTVQQKPYKD